jgi:hypothetical protein
MSPVQSRTGTVPRACLHHEVVESGPLLMISGTPADACRVAVITGPVARRSMDATHETHNQLKI